ncbi:calpain family cysteine protease [Ancylostoma ceylanicum]|uniref:Calpain family cysteine protease n=1 Tax=Ancylostoma ceylanicum TaxID=53326 RepID=A0A0D6L8T9_9BILA|nr:calpain family cysteine protease [Ancylostoma ceylanicum]
MALIAERPDVLEHILLTKEYSHCGVYQVRLCIDGQWKIVLVDDFFPCRPETRSIAFADGRKNQVSNLWVPLIEKALAKQLGSYSRLRAGRTIEGLAMLTDLKRKLLSGEPSTGTFWISYDDFLSHFDSVDIAKIRWYQGWAELRIPIQMGGEFMNSDRRFFFLRAVRILIEEPTEVCLTLFQGGARTAHDQSLNGVFPRYITENFSGLLLMVDNVLEDMWVHVKVECSNSTNVLSSRGTLDVADSIPPLSRQLTKFSGSEAHCY